MALTSSTMLPLGSKAPDFQLPDTEGNRVSLDDLYRDSRTQVVTVIFLCNHCPYVKHVRHELARLAREYGERGVAFVGINSNDATAYPDDSPEQMVREKSEVGYTFPYLYDETQEVARAYQAACTPDFFVFDRQRTLVYRGQMDDSRPGNDLRSPAWAATSSGSRAMRQATPMNGLDPSASKVRNSDGWLGPSGSDVPDGWP